MFTGSHTVLKILAAFVWYTGGFVLLIKGISLLQESNNIQPGLFWPLLVVLGALLLGGVKAKYLFRKSCRKNLARIESLSEPMIWQFFRPGFFLALALMIATGATLSRMANGRYVPLLAVALLDLSIAVALLSSSIEFWKSRPATTAMSQNESQAI